MLGHIASSQTVLRLFPRNSCLSSRNLGVSAERTRSQGGLRPRVSCPGPLLSTATGKGSRSTTPPASAAVGVDRFTGDRRCIRRRRRYRIDTDFAEIVSFAVETF